MSIAKTTNDVNLQQGPYQIRLDQYPTKGTSTNPRRFYYSWFSKFSNWLEYSPTKDAAYCFLCYLSCDKPAVRIGDEAFIVKGFDKWKKVNNGIRCAFAKHIGSSQHKNALLFCKNLLNQAGHIENIFENQRSESKLDNCLRLKASIDIIRWLTFQACAFRGHDESVNSSNRGNFLELLKLLASYNDEVAKVVLENAPYNSKFTSASIQKELLKIIANKVRKHIRTEVGDSYFCVIIDESRDESKKEQMAIVLRFVDTNGVLVERLQLALVAASREVIPIHQFFKKLSFLINVICASSKRHDELQKAKALETERLLELGEIETGKGANQAGTLKRAGIIEDGSCSQQRGDADTA
ncbi:uncharacterized protein [Rutidosis leptorrhynchoides]|uniref:uncharacterized protein n=1 Tax=Rutidosis leptorrhynchoides TaxID=125765 RepID=UPI003A994582